MDPRWTALGKAEAELEAEELRALDEAECARRLVAACELAAAIVRSRPDPDVAQRQEPRSEPAERFWLQWVRRSRRTRDAHAR